MLIRWCQAGASQHAACLGQTGIARRSPALLFLLLITIAPIGCSQSRITIAETFPKASSASPWVLQGAVWAGTAGGAALDTFEENGNDAPEQRAE